MSRAAPASGCYDLGFRAGYPIDEPGEVALEDYARSLARATAAEAIRRDDDPGMVEGVHVCGPEASLTTALLNDVEDFARSLATRTGSGGLGWS